MGTKWEQNEDRNGENEIENQPFWSEIVNERNRERVSKNGLAFQIK